MINFLLYRSRYDPLAWHTSVTINPHAGHWVFLDNPEGMNRIFKAEMEEALRDHSSTTDPAA